MGVPQGSVICPILANLFLHYTFDKWMSYKNILTYLMRDMLMIVYLIVVHFRILTGADSSYPVRPEQLSRVKRIRTMRFS